MNLKYQPCVKTAFFQSVVNFYHCDLYDIGGCTLYGGVLCNTFAESLQILILCCKLFNISSSAEHSFNIAVTLSLRNGLLHIVSYAGIFGKIGADIFACFRH